LLALGAPGNASCRDVRELATTHLEGIRTKIKDLVKLERLLAKTIAQCSGKSVPDCPILDILDVHRSKG
jgi:MerR family mercuric resistance operon transcriptional regulator